MRLRASFLAPKRACRLAAAVILAAMPVAPAAAETPAASIAHPMSAPPAAAWGVTGSAPQTGSSAYTSGKAFAAPSAPPAKTPAAIALPPAKILVTIDKALQEMKVFVDNVERYDWAVSTGKRGYDTPSGTYTARSMNEMWYSKQWDSAPMPHAIFFTRKGHAIHGTLEVKNLGRPASHGCVRIAPENATTLFALVKEAGVTNTEIVLSGEIPPPTARMASSGARKQAIKPHKKTAVKRGAPGGKAKVASAGPRKLKVKPGRTLAYQGYAASEFDGPRRLSRKEWYRLYYSAPPTYAPSSGRWRYYSPY